MFWCFRTKVLIICLIFCFLLSILISMTPIMTSECKCSSHSVTEDIDSSGLGDQPVHRLAVVVPFRDRFDELLTFVPNINRFLRKQRIHFKIYIVNQKDVHRFNRASLINIGFLISRSECDYMAMHDIDLIPLNPNLSYHYPIDGPFHVAAPELHPKYHYKTFVGGILVINRHHFERVNGLSNQYWGWGLEDDEFYARLKDANLIISRPEGIKTGINDTFSHIHMPYRRRDTIRLFNQKEVTRKRDRKTGLNSVQFRLLSTNELTIDKVPVTVYNVQLICDITQTPWCQTKESVASNVKRGKGGKNARHERERQTIGLNSEVVWHQNRCIGCEDDVIANVEKSRLHQKYRTIE